MSLARLVVTAVRMEGRTKAEVSRDYGVSPRWVYELCRRFDAEGEAAWSLVPAAPREPSADTRQRRGRDRRAPQGAHRRGPGCRRPHDRLSPDQASRQRASVATIWRILSRRGFVTPQPQKRPRSSFIRFEADLPNERWQADITHWRLADGTEVEILNVIDDHSRLLVASDVRAITKAADVVASFHRAAAATGSGIDADGQRRGVHRGPRKGRCAIELETAALGIGYRHSSPYHPQTCGKVERFTRPSSGGWPSRNRRRHCSSSRPSSIGSVPTTTTSDRTGRSGDEPLPRRSRLGPRRRRGCRGSWSLPTSGSARTRSTSPARSRCVTTRGCTTSGWGVG